MSITDQILELKHQGFSPIEVIRKGFKKTVVYGTWNLTPERKEYKRIWAKQYRDRNKLRASVKAFKRGEVHLFTEQDVINKFGEQPICQYTGKLLNYNAPHGFSLDHIIPSSKGGTNTLENMAICSYQVNLAKNTLSKSEFISLCRDVVTHADSQIPDPEYVI